MTEITITYEDAQIIKKNIAEKIKELKQKEKEEEHKRKEE